MEAQARPDPVVARLQCLRQTLCGNGVLQPDSVVPGAGPPRRTDRRISLLAREHGYDDILDAFQAHGVFDSSLDGSCCMHLDGFVVCQWGHHRSEEHTSELQSLMRISYAVFCLKKKQQNI